MENITEFNPDLLVYAGGIGIFSGLLLLIFFLYRRIRGIIHALSGEKSSSPGPLISLGKLMLIIIWTSLLGMAMFLGLFLRTYHAFTHERPVAEIRTEAFDDAQPGPAALVHFSILQPQTTEVPFTHECCLITHAF